MSTLRILTPRRALWLIAAFGLGGTAGPAGADDLSNLGADYAFLFLTTLSPDFAAADYTLKNPDGTDVDLSIYRLPYQVDLITNPEQRLQFEVALAYQKARQQVPTFPGENIDSRWTTAGLSAGLLYEQQLAGHLRFTPSLRLGVARMHNRASYNGTLTNLIKDQFEGTLLNWQTDASVTNVGLGLSYDWALRDRVSRIKADVYHARISSFDESNPAVKFSEPANMLALRADLIFPTDLTVAGKRLDLVVLPGLNTFFGENHDTLGYNTSYQLGLGSELPLTWHGELKGYLRLSGQVLWAENMTGWLVTVGYTPD